MYMLLVGAVLFLGWAANTASAKAPHILLMVLDDIGRADTGLYGKSNIPMPNLVNLARDGVIFENFYTQTVCSPTRSSLLTGLYPFRFGMQHFTTQLPGMTAGVPLDVPMLPALLKEKGYERHMIGKWHCGYATWGHTPSKRGFQSFTGYLQAQGDYYKHNFALAQFVGPEGGALDGFDFWQNTKPMLEAKGNYSLDIYRNTLSGILNDYASRQNTLEKQADHPLFIYLAHQTVHIPLQYRNDESRCAGIKHKARNIYCSMMVELDDAIKEMTDQFQALGLWDNLLILVMTDNGGMVNFSPSKTDNFPSGAASQGSNYPLRGSKTSMFDGGVRSSAFAAGGYLPKEARGRRVKDLVHVVDFSATILSAAHILPLRREELSLDGHNLLGLLMNRPGATSLRDHVPINIVLEGNRYSAVRFGKFKLIIDDFLIPAAHGWFDENGDLKEPSPDTVGKTLLFDLENDPQERKDVSEEYPSMVQYGIDLIQSYIQGGDYMEPQESKQIHPRALPVFHGGVWKPFMAESTWTERYQESRVKQQKKRESEKTSVVAMAEQAMDADVQDSADEQAVSPAGEPIEQDMMPLVAEKRRLKGMDEVHLRRLLK